MFHIKPTLSSFLLLAGIVACGDADPAFDGGIGRDAQADTVIDAPTAEDSSVDAGDDSSLDGGMDGSTDSAIDAGPSPSCSSGPYEGNTEWGGLLRVAEGARLCAHMNDPRGGSSASLAELIANKSEIHLVAGEYPLPTETVSAPFLIPMCVQQAGDSIPVTAASEITVQQDIGISRPAGTYITATMLLGEEMLEASFARPTGEDTVRVDHEARSDFRYGATVERGGFWYTSCTLAANSCREFTLPGGGDVRLGIWC